ncbi:MAG TPA: hypothetical protein VKE22_04920 [Haliangiales bacterium]|nr:hypothetical protein [Haliangiales bacterium]
MKLDQIADILAKQIGAKREGAALLMPAEMDVTLFVALPGETLAVSKIIRVEIAEPMLVCDTSRGDRVVFLADDVRAVRGEKGDGARRDRSAGFR